MDLANPLDFLIAQRIVAQVEFYRNFISVSTANLTPNLYTIIIEAQFVQKLPPAVLDGKMNRSYQIYGKSQ